MSQWGARLPARLHPALSAARALPRDPADRADRDGRPGDPGRNRRTPRAAAGEGLPRQLRPAQHPLHGRREGQPEGGSCCASSAPATTATRASSTACRARRSRETAKWLREQGLNALPYHAGFDAATREAHQTQFIRGDGIIMVATIAFGMGIDKPDVRFVAHLDLPKSLEAYYQETGRAGRDGLPSNAWMAYGLQDMVLQREIDRTVPGARRDQTRRAPQARCAARLLRGAELPPPSPAALFRRGLRALRQLRHVFVAA